jgi:hypothetical protein
MFLRSGSRASSLAGGSFTHTSDHPRHRQRTSKIIDITNHVVCDECNSGWMSDFEARAQPLLDGPIQGEPRSFTATEQIGVASWAFKTALMLDCSWPGRTIPQNQYRHLYRFRVPPSTVHIWVMAYHPAEGEEFSSAWGQRFGLDLTTASGPRHDFRMTFSVGHFVCQLFGNMGVRDELHVESTIELGERTAIDFDFIRPLWPVSLLPLEWPPKYGFSSSGLTSFGK